MKIKQVNNKHFSVHYLCEDDKVYAAIFYCHGQITNVWQGHLEVWADQCACRHWLSELRVFHSISVNCMHGESEMNFLQRLNTCCWDTAEIDFLKAQGKICMKV